jgi:hypothetical protein
LRKARKATATMPRGFDVPGASQAIESCKHQSSSGVRLFWSDLGPTCHMTGMVWLW